MKTEQQILDEAQSVDVSQMAGYIEDVREGNPSIWLLKELYDLWESKRKWSF